ncbi:hypothetical protein P4361_18625 [Fictibacillus sp. B-59209]|uniref:hypothetical protein n=1 Tax=Fictibacillus sp. B-59209 TaxID=3024873 RepID=UPI002E205925|nr:hypothetical protein [Fictibacillus sp. B-59209]
MWSKFQQAILWIITYSPLVIVMVFRFIAGNKYFGLDEWLINQPWVSKDSIFVSYLSAEVYFVIATLIYTYFSYKYTIKWFMSGFEERIRTGEDGQDMYIRKAERLSANDYSFFLLTLLIPLVSLDHSSVINLAVSVIIIFFVIAIYVKTDAISVCPLLFFSGRSVFKGVISLGEKEQESNDSSLRKDVIFIMMKNKITFNRKVRGERLVNDVYYLTNNEIDND